MIRLLRNLFLRNWILKLAALSLAFVLWLTLIPEEKIFSEKTFVVPLETQNLSDAYEISERPQATVDVTVRAPNRLLGQMTSADVQAILDLRRATVNQEDYPLNPDLVSVPPEAKVVRVFPNKARIKLERAKEVLMDVQTVIVGKPKPGFRVESTELIPSKVYVRGPESKIRPKDQVRTTPVDVAGLDETDTFRVDLVLPRPELRFSTGQTSATVKVIVAPVK
jgi:YbbR domain-containing protein